MLLWVNTAVSLGSLLFGQGKEKDDAEGSVVSCLSKQDSSQRREKERSQLISYTSFPS